MKVLIFLFVSLRAFAVTYNAPFDHQVVCEIALGKIEKHVGPQLNEMLLRNEFRLIDYAATEPLLALYGLKPSPLLSAVTASFRYANGKYQMILFDAPKHPIYQIEIPIAPLMAWPLLAIDRDTLEYEYAHGFTSAPEIIDQLQAVPDEVHYGTLVVGKDEPRFYYFSAEKVGEQVYVNLGIDLPESMQVSTGNIQPRLLRADRGWFRRIRVLTFAIDDDFVRAHLFGRN